MKINKSIISHYIDSIGVINHYLKNGKEDSADDKKLILNGFIIYHACLNNVDFAKAKESLDEAAGIEKEGCKYKI